MAQGGLLLLVVALLMLRLNLVVVLFAVAIYVHLAWGGGHVEYLVEDLWISLDSPILLSIPMFLLAGSVMNRGDIAARLFDIARAFTAPLPGGLGVAAILCCALFAAVSGSSAATMLAVGAVFYPAMRGQGFGRRYAMGAITAAGTLGIVIPPSVPMIIYGLMAEVSVADMFLAGVGPGLLLTLVLALHALIANRHLPRGTFDARAAGRALRRGGWALMLPVLLFGGIYSGLFTPTEAAAVTLGGALVVELAIHRALRLRDLYPIAVETARLLGMLFPIIAVALSLRTILVLHQIPQEIVGWLTGMIGDPLVFLLGVNLLLLVVGCLFDAISALLILTPLLLPVARAYGIDPVHFGVIMVVNLEIGFLTPPLGMNLFVAVSAFGERFGEVCRSVLPFVAIMLAVLVAVTLAPGLSLFLVR